MKQRIPFTASLVPSVLCVLGVLAIPALAAPADMPPSLDRCNVVWTTPSEGSSGSMPLGNGDLAMNLWVEPNGDLVLYLSKTDAWSGNGRLLKLGGVRLSLTPSLVRPEAPFRQTLDLRKGAIEIVSGEGDDATTALVWVDANRPVVHLETYGGQPCALQAKLEVWRTERRELAGAEKYSAYGIANGPDPVVVEPDAVLPPQDNRVTWLHRNERSCYPVTLQVQALGDLLDRFPDPLLNRTFGGCLKGEGLVSVDDTTLRSETPGTRHHVAIHVLTAQTETAHQWGEQLDRLVRENEAVSLADARRRHERWWADFWNRSWIFAETPAAPGMLGAITTNDLPLRIGGDSDGRNRFRGRMARASVMSRALSEGEVRSLAQVPLDRPVQRLESRVASWRFDRLREDAFTETGGDDLPAKIVGDLKLVEEGQARVLAFDGSGYLEVEHDERLNLTGGFTLEAWIAPAKLGGGGARIIDKSKAGTANGYLLDTYPGNSLRSIVQAGTLVHEAKLPPDEWSHVAATFDPKTDRQCLYVNGKLVAERGGDLVEDEAGVSPLTRGYVLQRFINACAGRGAYPIKFNGTLFTVDAEDRGGHWDADYRRWGGCYWFQNTRLPYWSMLHAGDFDLMQPLFRMYLEALPLSRERTRKYYDHGGAHFPETMYFWGTYNNDNYGWKREGKPDGLTDNTCIRYYWDSGLELTTMMLDYFALTQDGEFASNTLLPFASEILMFYEQHYPKRDPDGKMVIEPAQALETWQKATNPLPIVAGLRYVIHRLQTEVLPRSRERQLVDATTKLCERMKSALPDLPTAERGGSKRLLPAATFDQLRNSENPELYAIFPYRLYGVGKPDLAVGRATFEARRVKRTGGWTQDPIQAAMLGLTETAAAYTYKNFSTKHKGSRFPAFWGPNFDWVPDQDHGGVAMIALQRMLMQCDDDKILLLPAWPKEWNVDFKLHAPKQTTVRCVWREGEVQRLEVTPKNRARDVVLAPAEGTAQAALVAPRRKRAQARP